MKTIEQLVQSIDTYLEALHAEIDSLTRARHRLVTSATVAARPAAAPARRRNARRARRRDSSPSSEVAPADELHRLLSASDGLSTAALAEQANADPAQVLPLLRQLEAEGRVRRTGQRRGTRWHAVASEDEWIAKRAADLAERSRSS